MAGHPASQTIFPYLSVDGAEAALAFYVDAFQGEDTGPTLRAPDGAVLHAEVRVGRSAFFLAEAAADPSGASPAALGGAPVRMAIDVPDVDAFVARAADRGAEVLIEPADQFYGYRSGRIRDPFGHVWVVSTKIEDVSSAEMQRRLDAMTGGGG